MANQIPLIVNAGAGQIQQLATGDNLSVAGNIVTGNILTDGYYYANGTPVSFGSNYGNANVAEYLPTFTGNLAGNNISLTGNVYTDGKILHLGEITGNGITANGAGIVVGANVATILYDNSVFGWTVNEGWHPAANVTYNLGRTTRYWNNFYAVNVNAVDIAVSNSITVNNIINSNIISASGNITTAGYFVGNFQGNISGNLVVPGSNTQVLYNNSGNAGASTGLTFDSASNAMVVAGNVTASNFIGNLSNGASKVSIANNGNVSVGVGPFGTTVLNVNTSTGISVLGNVVASGYISATGNIAGNYILGNGSQLTNLPAPTVTQDITSNGDMSIMTYDGNIKYVNNATIEPSSGNIKSAGNISATGNISGTYFIGNGSQLTGLPSGYGNTEVAAYLAGSAGNIIPGANLTYSLGNSTNWWSNVWVAGNTIYIGGVPLGMGAGNVLTVDGNAVLSNDSDTSINTTGNITANTFFTTANLKIGTNPDIVVAGDHSEIKVFGSADTLQIGWEDTAPGINNIAYIQFNDYYGGIQFVTGNTQGTVHGILFDETGNLAIPGNIVSADSISLWSGDAVSITSNNTGLPNTWNFDESGNLTVPGNIQTVTTGFPFTSNISGINTGSPTVIVTLTDSVFGAPETGQVTITGVVGTTEANNTWYYGSIDPSNFVLYNDAALTDPVDGTTWTAYVSDGLAVSQGYNNLSITGGNVSIVTNTGNTWIFGTDGNLTIPNDIVSNTTIDIDNRASGNGADIRLFAADDITIQARDRSAGSTTEGGDINIFAGDSAEDSDTSAGDIVIEAGRGGASNIDFGGSGGFVRVEAGDGGDAIGANFSAQPGGSLTLNAGHAGSNNGNIDLGAAGANVYIGAGDSTGNGVNGGTIYLTSGAADASALAGDVVIQAGGTWTFDATGNLTLPNNTFAVNYANGTPVLIGGGGNASTGNVTFNDVNIIGTGNLNLQPDAGNSEYLNIYLTASDDIHIAGTGNVILGTDEQANVAVLSDGNVAIQAGNVDGKQIWDFDTAGNLTLPRGGVVYETNIPDGGLNGNTIALKPSGGTNADQQLLIYPTTNDANHLHLTTGNLYSTELFLGSDDLYVKLANTGNVVINSNDGNGNVGTWTFGSNGNLTLPGGSLIDDSPTGLQISGAGQTAVNRFYTKLSETLYETVDAGVTYRIIDQGQWSLDVVGEDNPRYTSVDLITWADAGGGLPAPTGTIINGSANVTVSGNTWTFGADGSLTFPIGISIDDNVDPLYPKIIADSGKLFSVQGQGANGSAALAWSLNPNTDTQYAAVGVNKGGGDDLAKVVLTAGNTTPTLKVWKFDETGNITLPQGGIVYETTIPGGTLTGNTIALKPQGGTNADQQLLVYPTALGADANHLHLTTGNLYNTELFLGNDDLYVKLANTGNVVINSNNGNGSIGTWTFGADGNLTLPGNAVVSSPGSMSLTSGGSFIIESGPSANSIGSVVSINGGQGATGGGATNISGGFAVTGPGGALGLYGGYSSDGASSAGNVTIGTGDGEWIFDNTGKLNFPRPGTGNVTIPYLSIVGGENPTITSTDASLAGPANLSIVSNYLEMSGFNGNTVTIYADNGEISTSDYLVLTTNTAGNTNSWLFDPTGSLTLPPINLGVGTDEQTVVQSQRKLIPSFRWSAVISGNTPTVVYTAINANTTSMKVTVQVQHSGLGMELFDVSATYTGADTYYTVSNRVAPPTIAASAVVVDLNGSNTMQITITIDSGATTSWVTYDAVEFGIPND